MLSLKLQLPVVILSVKYEHLRARKANLNKDSRNIRNDKDLGDAFRTNDKKALTVEVSCHTSKNHVIRRNKCTWLYALRRQFDVTWEAT